MGHVLSKNGVAPEKLKIKAVASAREPKNAGKVHSFLERVNYCGQFIPDLATISEPLQKLTQKVLCLRGLNPKKNHFKH